MQKEVLKEVKKSIESLDENQLVDLAVKLLALKILFWRYKKLLKLDEVKKAAAQVVGEDLVKLLEQSGLWSKGWIKKLWSFVSHRLPQDWYAAWKVHKSILDEVAGLLKAEVVELQPSEQLVLKVAQGERIYFRSLDKDLQKLLSFEF